MKPDNTVRMAVVGDLLFTTPYDAKEGERGLEALTPEIRTFFSESDLVMANLESTLPAEERISSEPRVFGTSQQFESLQQAHVNIASLANNHTFDALERGFEKTRNKLEELGIHSFGAGTNLQQAQKCVSINIRGTSIALIGAVAPSSGMKFFAAEQSPGVTRLETEQVCTNIKHLKKDHDHVIFSPHWGMNVSAFPRLNK